MSIIFGIRKPEGALAEGDVLLHFGRATASWAPDGTFVKSKGQIGMGFQPYHTHQRSNLESQPAMDDLGNMITLDGRIDNHNELCELLAILGPEPSDSTIILAAFRRWGERCFSRFVGDWALAIWSQRDQTLYLARDHAGTRTLYYEDREGDVVWSTFLETFFADNKSRDFDDAYAAHYLSCQPIRDLTPYKSIRAVTPTHYFAFGEGGLRRKEHWQWMTSERVQYSSDAEYEEQFVRLFRQAVQRRTGPGAPILAQLSGGMDSTSIVCMSDHIRRSKGVESANLLDTLSYYDDSEPNWNEKPYFSLVEEKRGRKGHQVKTSYSDRSLESPDADYLLPGGDSSTLAAENQLNEICRDGDFRVILSGIGGDEFLGGRPNPLPELADYLASGRLPTLLRQSVAWCLTTRTPLLHMVRDVGKFTFGSYLPSRNRSKAPPWISEELQYKLTGLRMGKSTTLGHPPSAIYRGLSWWAVMEVLPHQFPAATVRREYRYPMLDRDLVDFLFRVPSNQLLKPGSRRDLMRRALRSIVPSEILNRRRKASVIRGPISLIVSKREKIRAILRDSQLAALGYIDEEILHTKLTEINFVTPWEWQPALLRAISLERWLKDKTEIGQPNRSTPDVRAHTRSV